MSDTLNRFSLLGILGHEIALKSGKNGKPFCRMSLGTHQKSFEGESKTQWHSVHIFGKQAEWACASLKKGQPVFVEGEMESLKLELENEAPQWKQFLRAKKIRAFGGDAPQTTT